MNRNDQQFMAQRIRAQYMEKTPSELDVLRELDAKVKRPANVFAYTFATPATTQSSSVSDAKYNSIFNIVNVDDVISYIPLSEWNFGRYGITREFDMKASGLTSEWCSVTGQKAYNAIRKSIIKRVLNILYTSCGKTRSDVYEKAGPQIIDTDQYNKITERQADTTIGSLV